jgi:hypothetical protein
MLIQRPWVRQPQTFVGVNWGNPLVRGLVALIVPAGDRYFEIVTRQLTELTGTPVVGATIDGNRAPARRVKAPPTANKFPNPTGADAIVGPWSVFWEGSPEANAQATDPVFMSSETTNGRGFKVGFDDAFAQFNAIGAGNNYLDLSFTSNADALGTDSENYTHRVMATSDGNDTYSLYAKGALNRSGTAGLTTNLIADAARRSYICAGILGESSQAGASVIAVFNVQKTLEEYAALYFNPWQLLAPLPRRMWAPSAASGIPTLSAATVTAITTTTATPRVTLTF